MFPNKLHSSAVQNTFEFDRFFKLQNVVKSRIHFNIRKRGAYIRGGGGGGLTNGCIFFVYG